MAVKSAPTTRTPNRRTTANVKAAAEVAAAKASGKSTTVPKDTVIGPFKGLGDLVFVVTSTDHDGRLLTESRVGTNPRGAGRPGVKTLTALQLTALTENTDAILAAMDTHDETALRGQYRPAEEVAARSAKIAGAARTDDQMAARLNAAEAATSATVARMAAAIGITIEEAQALLDETPAA
jgi:hypothetical protein